MKKMHQDGFHVLPVLLIILVVSVIGFAGWRVLSSNKDDTKQGNYAQADPQAKNTQEFMQQYGDVCKDRKVSFTQPPVPFDQMAYIQPLGMVNDGHVTPTDHVYVTPKNMSNADNTTDVIMPADGTVIDVSAMPAQYIGDRNQQTASEDHRLVIAHNCRYFSILIHVHKLSDKLAAAVGDLQPNQTKRISLELKAGDKIGKIGSNPVDWTSLDTNKELQGFITPKLYISEPWKIHTISPFDMYSGGLKTKMESYSLRTKAPLGGKIDHDKRGALIGNWFQEGTNGYAGADRNRYWDGHLSIAPDFIDGETTIVSMGNWSGKAAQYAVKGSFNPAMVTANSGEIKVELMQISRVNADGSIWSGGRYTKGMKVSQGANAVGIVLFQVEKGEKLKFEAFPGKTPAQVTGFTSAAKTYVR